MLQMNEWVSSGLSHLVQNQLGVLPRLTVYFRGAPHSIIVMCTYVTNRVSGCINFLMPPISSLRHSYHIKCCVLFSALCLSSIGHFVAN